MVYSGDTGKMPSLAGHLEWMTSTMEKLACWLTSIKECGPYVVIFLNRTPIFEWYMSKTGHQKDTLGGCDEFGLCA